MAEWRDVLTDRCVSRRCSRSSPWRSAFRRLCSCDLIRMDNDDGCPSPYFAERSSPCLTRSSRLCRRSKRSRSSPAASRGDAKYIYAARAELTLASNNRSVEAACERLIQRCCIWMSKTDGSSRRISRTSTFVARLLRGDSGTVVPALKRAGYQFGRFRHDDTALG